MQRKRILFFSRSAPPQFIGVFALILVVAAVLRMWGLPGIPPGPHYDEAANGILAAEIADGVKTPLFISSYTGKEVLFFYTAAAAMRVLGVGLLALRLTAALAGLLTVAVSAWLTYELFADDHPGGAVWLAALSAALMATSFWHVVLSRIGFRAITQPLLQALTLAALWRGLRRAERPDSKNASRGWLLLGGFLGGLTGYTYLAARAFPVPLVIALVTLLWVDTGRRRQRLTQFTLFGLAALVSFAPLGHYFWRHPDAFSTRMGQVGPGNDWSAAVRGMGAAFKMLFVRGDPYIRFNLPFRPLFGPVVAVLLISGLGITAWRFARPRAVGESRALARARETLLLIWIPIMLLPTALAVNEITPSNLRAIGLIPLVFVLPARGLWALLGTGYLRLRRTHDLSLFATCLLLLFTAFIAVRAYFAAYVPRSDLYTASDGDLADIAGYLNQADLAGKTIYVGSVHYRHPTLAFLAHAYPHIKWLVGASTIVYPARGEALYLFPRSATPGEEWLGRYLPDATPIQAAAATDGAPAFTGLRLADAAPSYNTVLADFSGIVRLLDYRVERAVSGEAADVTVVWQILAPPSYPGLNPFYHLVDLWGVRWGQAEPFRYAAADWTPGEVVVNRVQVPIGAGAPPGAYSLEVGYYSQSADVRLAVIDAAGRFAGTTFPLTLTVARAETPPKPDRLRIRRRVDVETSAGITLLGSNLDTLRARPGERVNLTLFWQVDKDRPASVSNERADYAVELLLRGVGEDDISLYDGAPVHGTHPVSHWTDSEIIVDHYNPRLPLMVADAPPGAYPLTLTLAVPDGEVLLGPHVLGTITLVATERDFDVPAMGYTQQVPLADQIELLGYDIEPVHAGLGEILHLTLYWRALAEMDTSYTVFIHLLGPEGHTVAQQDNPPVNGTYPTTLWLPGEIMTDPYDIALPADVSPGDYSVEIGFYIAENGLRLADAVLLNTVITIHP